MPAPIRKPYQDTIQTQQKTLQRIKRCSVALSILYSIMLAKFLVSYRLPNLPLLVDLLDAYIFVSPLVSIGLFKWQEVKEKQVRESMGEVVDYCKAYLEVFRIVNYLAMVLVLIRADYLGLGEWHYGLLVLAYAAGQLVMGRAMDNIEGRVLLAVTELRPAE